MNKILNVLFILSVLVSLSAKAIVMPGWERPIYQATLVEMDERGHEIGVDLQKNLIMGKLDGAKHATSLTLTEEHRVFCIQAPCPPLKRVTVFQVNKVEPAGCGSLKYLAIDATPDFHHKLAQPKRRIEVIDHSMRVCDDYRKYVWEVKVIEPGTKIPHVRKLFGNPEPVYTIQ